MSKYQVGQTLVHNPDCPSGDYWSGETTKTVASVGTNHYLWVDGGTSPRDAVDGLACISLVVSNPTKEEVVTATDNPFTIDEAWADRLATEEAKSAALQAKLTTAEENWNISANEVDRLRNDISYIVDEIKQAVQRHGLCDEGFREFRRRVNERTHEQFFEGTTERRTVRARVTISTTVEGELEELDVFEESYEACVASALEDINWDGDVEEKDHTVEVSV